MSKKIKEREEGLNYIGPDDPRWDKMVEDFVAWYVEEWSKPMDNGTGIPFVIDIQYTKKEHEAVIVVGEEEVRNYMEGKKE